MLMAIITFIIGLAGAGLITAGAWLINPAAGFITGGVLCLMFSYFAARSSVAGSAGPGAN